MSFRCPDIRLVPIYETIRAYLFSSEDPVRQGRISVMKICFKIPLL